MRVATSSGQCDTSESSAFALCFRAIVIHIYRNNSTEFVPLFYTEHCSLVLKTRKIQDVQQTTEVLVHLIEVS